MDEMDPQKLEELERNLASLNANMGVLESTLSTLAITLAESSEASRKNTDSINRNTRDSNDRNERKKRELAEEKKAEEATRLFESSLKNAISAVSDFSGALLSGVDGFDKYGGAIKGFGESAKQTGEALGGFSKYVGAAINIMAQLTAVMLKQADAQNKFAKEMDMMGGIAGSTTQELAALARDAGMSARNLEELTPILQKTSKALASFGAGTTDGMVKLMKVFALTDEQERTMRRYGYTLREAQEEQAYYIELQRLGGINMQMQNLGQARLRKDTMDYGKNLRVLSELTGVRADELKSEQAIVAADTRNRIRNITDQTEMMRITRQLMDQNSELSDVQKKELQERKDYLDANISIRNQLAQDLPAVMGKEMAAKAMNVIGTGAFNTDTRSLALQGFNPSELMETFQGGDMVAGSEEYIQALATLSQDFVDATERNADLTKTVLQLGDNRQEVQEVYGLSDEALEKIQAIRGGMQTDAQGNQTYQSTEQKVIEAYKAVTKATQEGADAQLDFAAQVQVTETNIRTAADKAMNALNPFTGAVDISKIAVAGLGTAAFIAAGQLAMMSGLGKGGLMEGFKNMFKKMPKVFSSMSSLKTVAKNSKVLGGAGVGVALSIASGVSDARDSTQNARMEYFRKTSKLDAEKDKIEIQGLKEERDRQITMGRRGGTGTAVGGASGALAGAAAGALIGSAIPFVGTAIGGIIGAGIGAWAGSAAGKAAFTHLLTPDELAAGELSEAQIKMLSTEDKAKYEEDKATADAKIDAEKTRQEELATLLSDELKTSLFHADDAETGRGLYDKDLAGNSEVNFDMLGEMKRSGKLTADMLEAILLDNDINEESKAILEEELQILKDKKGAEATKEEVETETKEPSGRTMDRPMEELILIFEADIRAQENIKKEQEENLRKKLDDTTSVVKELVGSASGATGQGTIDANGNIVVGNGNRLMDSGGELASGEVGIVGELGPELVEGPANVTSRKDTTSTLERLSAMMNTIDKLRGGDKANDDIKGKVIPTQDTVDETNQIIMQAFKLAGIDTKYVGSGHGESDAAFAALEEMIKPLEMDISGADDIDLDDMMSSDIDISPEVEAEDIEAKESTAKAFAQSKTDTREMTEFEKRTLALQEQQIQRLTKIETLTSDSADSQQKIATYASV